MTAKSLHQRKRDRVARPSRWIWLGVLALIMTLQTGCALKVTLVGQYDEIVDEAVHDLQMRTAAHIGMILTNEGTDEGSYEQTKSFYSEIRGEIYALTIRAEALEEGLKRTPLTDNFKALQQQYVDLERVHQMPFNKNIIQSAQAAMEQSYRAIVKHMVYLKWNQKQPKNN